MTKETPKVSQADMELAFEEAVAQNRYCSLGRIIAEDPNGPVIKAKVEDNLHYSSAVISRVLKKLNYPPVSADLITKHRNHGCRCAEV